MPSGPPPGVRERRSLRSRFRRKLRRIPHPRLPGLSLSEVRVLRLFLLLGLFSVLVLYGVFRSTRFQELMRRKAERLASERVGREVRIGGFDLSLVPPAFVVRDVWVANDPRGLKGAPCFSAEEIAIKGIPNVTSSRIDLPKLRLIRPRLLFEIFEDGSTNVDSIRDALVKGKPGGGGPDLRIREALLQRGSFRFREWDAKVDVLLKDAALSARSVRFSRVTRASLACRSAQFRLEDNRVLDFELGAESTLSPGRVHLDLLRLRSDRIAVDASGGIENLATSAIGLDVTAATTGEALHDLFGLQVPITGGIAAAGVLRIDPKKGIEGRARFVLPDGKLGPFPMTAAEGDLRVDAAGLLVHLDRATYAGGTMEALVRLERLKHPPLPIRIDVKGRGISFERFLADIDLPGTGLMAKADVDTTLTFQSDIEKADGAGSFRLSPLPGVPSAVAGRAALPVSGGGPILIRKGLITFAGTPLDTAGGAHLTLDGTLAFGSWTPDWTLALRAPAPEAERIASNLFAAIQKRPLRPPLKLDGAVEMTARLTRAFSDPHVEGRLSATDFVLKGVRFGTVDGAFTVDHNVATLAPFHARDEGGALTLTGNVGWGGKLKDEYLLDGFAAEFDRWPIERVLQFLTFDLPITGRVTGRLALEGITPQVLGAVPMTLEEGSIWGQPVSRLAGTLGFEKGRLVLAGVRGTMAGGEIAGSGFFRYADRGYAIDVSGRGLALGGITAARGALAGLAGVLEGRITGEGTLDRPGYDARGSVTEASLDGHPLAPPGTPLGFHAVSRRGDLEATLEAAGAARLVAEVPADPASPAKVRLEVLSLTPYDALLRVPEEARLAGSLAVAATLRRSPEGAALSASGEIARAELTAYGKKIWIAGAAPFRWDGARFTFDRLVLRASDPSATAPTGELVVTGGGETAGEQRLDVSLNGSVDAGLLRAAFPDAEITGQIGAAARIGGTLAKPRFEGRLILDSIDFAPSGAPAFEGISGVVTLASSRATITGATLHYGGGTIGMDGSVGLEGLALRDIRINAHLARVKNQPFPGFRAVVSGDLVLRGEGELRSAGGYLTMESGVYDQDLTIGLDTLLGRLRSAAALPPAPTRFDPLSLNILVRIPAGAIEVRNNVARLRASGDLDVRGTFGRPILYGQIVAEEGGRLTLRGQRYELVAGKVLFSKATSIEPFFELTARTTIKEYQITLDLSGTFQRIAAHLSSDPQLSQAQAVSLLLTGELPGQSTLGVPTGATPVSTDESVATAARDLIAGLVTQAATERTKTFFRLDRLQIDPVFVGSSFDAPKLTVGKSIGKNLTVTYSYKASANQEQIIIAEYELSSRAFLQFVRDETGVYSVDLKFRQSLR